MFNRPFLAIRPFHSSPLAAKTVKDKISEVADVVNKKVGKGLASAIETGEKATKETLGDTTQQKATGAAQEKANEAASAAREIKEKLQKKMDE